MPQIPKPEKANDRYETSITYVPGANGSQTALVSTYTNEGDSPYNYEYDDNGNIVKIWRGSGGFANAAEKYAYQYDHANQLIQEDLYYGNGNSNNVSNVYVYNEWGNITAKRSYAYGDANGTVISANGYSYANSQWGDVLTSFNRNGISYDVMGNPVNYLGKTLTWNGKQLTELSFTIAQMTGTYSFRYDENGLRTQLIGSVNGNIVTTTNFYYNGSVLIAMTSGTIYQRFSYDAGGKVATVDYSSDSGSTYTTYYYLRNAQGDIVKLIDGSGNTVVEYTYDSWGKILSVTGTLATTLGANQPFRYRGYVYDGETQWYYLQSRYYDPAVRRFISADVYLSTGQGVSGYNSFAYCNNNPVAMEDTNGEIPMPWSWLPYWGFVHAAVQLYIACEAITYSRTFELERHVLLGNVTGRIDIYEPSTGRMWEVKPVGSEAEGVEQLCRYLYGVVKDATTTNKIGDPIPGGVFSIGKIQVEYHYAGSGVIAYSFAPTPNYKSVPFEEPLPQYFPKRSEELVRKNAPLGLPVFGFGFGFGPSFGFGGGNKLTSLFNCYA